MTLACEMDELDLIGLLDGELTENRARTVSEHAARCPVCDSKLRAQEALVGRLRAIPAEARDDDFAAHFATDLDRRLDALPRTPPRRSRRIAVVFSGLAATAAAAATVLFFTLPRVPDRAFTPRGSSRPWHDLVALSLAVEETTPVQGQAARVTPLHAGDRLRPGDGIVVRARNGNKHGAVHLMVFGVDSRGDVHWIQPGWSDPAQNPRSIELAPETELGPMLEATAPDKPAAGRFRVLWILSRSALDVRSVENLVRKRQSLAGPDRQVGSLELEMAAAVPPNL